MFASAHPTPSASLMELNPNNHLKAIQDANVIKRTWQITRFPISLADAAALCTDSKTFRSHTQISDSCRGVKEEILRPIVEVIGEYPVAYGGYSDIWQGTLMGGKSPTRELVAIKFLRHFNNKASQRTFAKHLEREVRVWSLLDHDNIALFHGVICHLDGTPGMVSPWYPNGSADVYLRNHPSVNPMKLIWEITLGVQYLHDQGVVHGDLKGSNVMVDKTGHAKLIDFGLSRVLDAVVGPSGLTRSTISFSIRWSAPELILDNNAQVTTATDVYALASTVLQLLTGAVPYPLHREIDVIMTILNKSPPQRPTLPLKYTIMHVDSLWGLLEECWLDACDRPSICVIKDRLRSFLP